MPKTSDIAGRIQEIRKRMSEASIRSGRQPDNVTLLAVTKTLSVETIQRAYDAGLRELGENRVQEAMEKMDQLPVDIRWHLIGQLQTNKINKIIGKFVLVHSVDSLHLAEALSTRIGAEKQDILLEVNAAGEESKAGTPPGEAVSTADAITKLPGIQLRGLMTVGPQTQDSQKQRESFKKLKELFEIIRRKDGAGPAFNILSMGMSGDFEIAIEEGSTLVRVGTGLFGVRA